MSKRLRLCRQVREDRSSVNFQDLPPEILCHILSYLQARDCLRLRLVSKQISFVVTDSQTWREMNICLRRIPCVGNRRWEFFQACGIRSIDISNCYGVGSTYKGLIALVKKLHIKEIYLRPETLDILLQLREDGVFTYDIPTLCLIHNVLNASRDFIKAVLALNVSKLCIKNHCAPLRHLFAAIAGRCPQVTHLDIEITCEEERTKDFFICGPEFSQFLAETSSHLVYLRINKFYLKRPGGYKIWEADKYYHLSLETLDLTLYRPPGMAYDLMGRFHDRIRGSFNMLKFDKLKHYRLNFCSEKSSHGQTMVVGCLKPYLFPDLQLRTLALGLEVSKMHRTKYFRAILPVTKVAGGPVTPPPIFSFRGKECDGKCILAMVEENISWTRIAEIKIGSSVRLSFRGHSIPKGLHLRHLGDTEFCCFDNQDLSRRECARIIDAMVLDKADPHSPDVFEFTLNYTYKGVLAAIDIFQNANPKMIFP